MSKRNRDPEREAKREKMSNLLQELKVSSMEDIHDLFKEMIGTFLENGLEGELDEELGYSKYDYKNISQQTTAVMAQAPRHCDQATER